MFTNHIYLTYKYKQDLVFQKPTMFDMTKLKKTYEQFTYISYI